jgi:hypothetical protein
MACGPAVERSERPNALAPLAGSVKAAPLTTAARAVEDAVKNGPSDGLAFGCECLDGGCRGRLLVTRTLTLMPAHIDAQSFPIRHQGGGARSFEAIESPFKAGHRTGSGHGDPHRAAAARKRLSSGPIRGHGALIGSDHAQHRGRSARAEAGRMLDESRLGKALVLLLCLRFEFLHGWRPQMPFLRKDRISFKRRCRWSPSGFLLRDCCGGLL